MGLISAGIERVEVFGLPCGVAESGEASEQVNAVLVKWRSSHWDKCHHVYVNGVYAGRTSESGQREMMVGLRSGGRSPMVVELFAVEGSDAGRDLSFELAKDGYKTGRVKLRIGVMRWLPLGARYEVYWDGGSGEVDYDKQLNGERDFIWPLWWEKCGFGVGRFGEGDWGYESGGGEGFGICGFGEGEFGFEAGAIEWVSDVLADGVYRFAVRILDAAGRMVFGGEEMEVLVLAADGAAGELRVKGFDPDENELVLELV